MNAITQKNVVRPNFFEEQGAPDETLLYLFCCLDTKKDVSSLGRTNKHLRQISSDDNIWKRLLINYFPHSLAQNQLKIENFNLCKKLTAIQNNLKNGVYTTSRLLLPFCPGSGNYQVHGNRIFHAPFLANSILIYDFMTQQLSPLNLKAKQSTLTDQQYLPLDLIDQNPMPPNLTPEQRALVANESTFAKIEAQRRSSTHQNLCTLIAQQLEYTLMAQQLQNILIAQQLPFRSLPENMANNFDLDVIIPQFQSSLENEAGNLTTSFHVHGQQLYVGGIYNANEDYFHETANGPTNTYRIAIWNLETLQLTDTFDIAGETYNFARNEINCLCVQKDELFLGIGKFVVIWDLEKKCIKAKIPASAMVLTLRVQENALFIRTLDNKISRCDLKAKIPVITPIYTFDPSITLSSFEIFENFHVLLSNTSSGMSGFCVKNAEDMSNITNYFDKTTLFGVPTPIAPAKFFQVCEGRFFAQNALTGEVYIFDFNDPSDQ